MTDDPYRAPDAALADAFRPTGVVRLYSPMQAGAAGFFGGPITAWYFIRANFVALGEYEAARKALVFGLPGVVALLGLLLMLPDGVPNTPFAFGYLFAARAIVEKYQLTKDAIAASPDHAFHGNWRVFGLILLGCVVTLVLMLSLALLVELLGFEGLGLIATWNEVEG